MTSPLRIAYVVAASGLFAALGCAARTPPEAPPRAPPGLALTVRGRGPDVVLVHGTLGDYRQWEPIGATLGRSYRVIAVSRRFHWPNPPPAGEVVYTFEAQSDDLAALLRSLGRPAHVVGHSYGAGVALLAALRHPELVRSLTLIEPPFGSIMTPPAGEFARELASRESLVAAVKASVRTGEAESASEVFIDWMQGGPGSFGRLPLSAQAELRANAATVGPTVAAPPPRVTCGQLHALRLPVLVLRGERTRPWFRLIAQAAADCIPGAKAAVIPAAAHMAIVENPSGAAGFISEFIARH